MQMHFRYSCHCGAAANITTQSAVMPIGVIPPSLLNKVDKSVIEVLLRFCTCHDGSSLRLLGWHGVPHSFPELLVETASNQGFVRSNLSRRYTDRSLTQLSLLGK